MCLMNDDGNRVVEGSLRPLLVNLTVPFDKLIDLVETGEVVPVHSAKSPAPSPARFLACRIWQTAC